MKDRFYIIITIIVLVVIVAIVAASTGGGTPPTENPEPTVNPEIFTFTISADIGVNQIQIVNLSTDATMRLTTADLPATYNFNRNDVLEFKVTSKQGYGFDHWDVDDGTWQSDNPLTLKPTGSFSMVAKCLTENQIGIIR